MSVAMPELPTTELGFSDAATDEMTPLPSDVMADTGDGLEPIDGESYDDVAVAEDAPQDDDPVRSALRAELESELRTSLTTELSQAHEKQFAELRSLKDRELAQMREEAFAVKAREPVLIQEFMNILRSYGIDAEQAGTNLELAIGRVDRAQAAATRQAQEQIATTEQVAMSLDERFTQRQEEAKARGELPLDPLDPTVRQWRAWFTTTAQQHFLGSQRAMDAMAQQRPISPSDMHSYREMETAIRRMNEFENKHRAALAHNAKVEADKRKAAAQKGAQTRQQNRGAQHIATSSGATPMTLEALITTVRKDPAFAGRDYDTIHSEALRRRALQTR